MNMKKLGLLALPIFSSQLCAQEQTNTPTDSNIAFDVSGELLYWKTKQDGLEYAFVGQGAGNLDIHGDTKSHNLDWDTGVRLGIGLQNKKSYWDIHFCWTHHKVDESDKIIRPQDDIFIFYGHPSVSASGTALKAKWDVETHLFDVEIGKSFSPKSREGLTMRYHLGIRGALIDQEYKADLTITNPPSFPQNAMPGQDIINNSQEFKGVGLRGGVDTEFQLFKNVSLTARAALSILWSDFYLHFLEKAPFNTGSSGGADPFTVDMKHKESSGKATSDLSVGLKWFKELKESRKALTLAISWEHHHFFNHNRSMRFLRDFPAYSFISNNGDLSYYGTSLQLKIDF